MLCAMYYQISSRMKSYDIGGTESKLQAMTSTKVAIGCTFLYLVVMILCWGCITVAIQDTSSVEDFQHIAAVAGFFMGAIIFTHQCILCEDVRNSWLCRKDKSSTATRRNGQPRQFHLLQKPNKGAGWDPDWDYTGSSAENKSPMTEHGNGTRFSGSFRNRTSELPHQRPGIGDRLNSAQEFQVLDSIRQGKTAFPHLASNARPTSYLKPATTDYYDSDAILDEVQNNRASYVDIADNMSDTDIDVDIWDGGVPRATPRRTAGLSGPFRRISSLGTIASVSDLPEALLQDEPVEMSRSPVNGDESERHESERRESRTSSQNSPHINIHHFEIRSNDNSLRSNETSPWSPDATSSRAGPMVVAAGKTGKSNAQLPRERATYVHHTPGATKKDLYVQVGSPPGESCTDSKSYMHVLPNGVPAGTEIVPQDATGATNLRPAPPQPPTASANVQRGANIQQLQYAFDVTVPKAQAKVESNAAMLQPGRLFMSFVH